MGTHSYITRTCSRCGCNWQARKDYKPKTSLCSLCITRSCLPLSSNPSWRGGRVEAKGYILIKLADTDPFYCMHNNHGYVAEHRLVIARHLGRPLVQGEIVHHIDGDKQNNQLNNLLLTTNGGHPHKYREAYELGYKAGFADGVRQANERNIGLSRL